MNNDENSSLVRRAGADLARSSPFDPGVESGPPPAGKSGLPLRALWRYRWSILGVTVVVAAAGLTALGLFLEPVYKAVAVLEFRAPETYLSPETNYRGAGDQPNIPTHVAIMRRNPELRSRVVGLTEVKATRWYQAQPSFLEALFGGSPPASERLGTDVTIEPEEKNTLLIRVSATVPSPNDAAILANAVADQYLSILSDDYSKKDKALIDELSKDRAELEPDISKLQHDIDERCSLSGAISPEQIVDHGRPRLDNVEDEIAKLNYRIPRLEYQLENLTNPKDGPTSQPEAVSLDPGRFRSDRNWGELNWKVLEARKNLDQLSEQFSDGSPTRDKLKRALDTAVLQLKDYEEEFDRLNKPGQVLPGDTNPAGRDAVADAAKLKAELVEAKQLLEFHMSRRGEFGKQSQKRVNDALAIQTMQTELAERRNRLAEIKKRKTSLEDNIRLKSPVRLSSVATIPTLPDNDKRIKFAAAILAAACAAGVGLALLRIRLAPQVQELSDIEPAISGAFVSNLPLGTRAMAENPLAWPAYSEAVRVLRTSLLARLGTDRCRVLQITSGGPGSGKSTLAAGLARSFADCGKQILLIDADFRRPSLSKRYSDVAEPGLTNVLARAATDDATIRATAWPGVSILSAGTADDSSNIDGIANGRFRGALDRWRQRFDLIVIDSPPMLASADAAILSTHVDGTLMVVRERHCHRRDLIESLAALGAAGGRLLGTVFVSSLIGRSYGYGYGYGYGDKYRDDADIRANDAIDDRTPLS